MTMYDELRGNLMAHATHFSVHDETSLLLLKAADAIEDLSKTLDEKVEINTALECNMPVWISVEERLPDENDVVLITDGLDVGTGYLVHGYGWISPFDDIEISHVFHWMPLPSPPESEEA